MSEFNLEVFIQQLRAAAKEVDAQERVHALMTEAFRNPVAVKSAMAGYSGDEEVLFEDDSVSIWYCGFDPKIHVPPHNHRTSATIGVYEGVENNHFYLSENGTLEHKSTKCLRAGDVISLGPDTIHTVETADEHYSYGIHVYLAPLTTIERSLFDWDTGEARPFTDENYEKLRRECAA